MIMQSPAVTVIVPCFNTALYLTDTLKSVEEQTFQDFEVIMVDDGSTDGTLAIMQDFATRHAHWRVIPLRPNQGIVAARNAALAQALGDYIAMLDGDDIWTSDALAVRTAIARQHPSAAVIATDFAWFENELPSTPIGRIGLGSRAQRAFANSFTTREPTVLPNPFELVATTHFAWTGATLVRRTAMTDVGNFDVTFKGPEDTLLWLCLAQQSSFAFLPQITSFYRQRAGSLVTLQKGPKELHYLKVLEWIKCKPQFANQAVVINRVISECHHVCVNYYRHRKNVTSAFDHALHAIKFHPQTWAYWRSLAAVGLDAVRNSSKKQKP